MSEMQGRISDHAGCQAHASIYCGERVFVRVRDVPINPVNLLSAEMGESG